MKAIHTDRSPDLDITRMVERLAETYRRRGAAHPVAAAASVTARGILGGDIATAAARLGLPGAELRRAEAGQVPFGDLPDAVGAVLERSGMVGLLGLADQAARYGDPLGPEGSDRAAADRHVDAVIEGAMSWAADAPPEARRVIEALVHPD